LHNDTLSNKTNSSREQVWTFICCYTLVFLIYTYFKFAFDDPIF